MQVRGRKHLDRKRKAAITLELKVPEDVEANVVEIGAKIGAKIGAFPYVKDVQRSLSCHTRRICKTTRKYG